jgi:hypothetical protein
MKVANGLRFFLGSRNNTTKTARQQQQQRIVLYVVHVVHPILHWKSRDVHFFYKNPDDQKTKKDTFSIFRMKMDVQAVRGTTMWSTCVVMYT